MTRTESIIVPGSVFHLLRSGVMKQPAETPSEQVVFQKPNLPPAVWHPEDNPMD